MAQKQSWDNIQEKVVTVPKKTEVYLLNYNTMKELIFHIVPETIIDIYNPTHHTESNIFGRTTPLYFYTGGGDKTLSFSMKIHEDDLPKGIREKDIYTFLKTLQTFSEPYIPIGGGGLRDPDVFIQIGDQFIGRGFISANWSLNTPYRAGRYIVADLNISFTYNQTFTPPEIEIDTQDNKTYISDIIFQIRDTYPTSGVNIGELREIAPEQMDYEYIRQYVYEDLKLHEQYKPNSILRPGIEEWMEFALRVRDLSDYTQAELDDPGVMNRYQYYTPWDWYYETPVALESDLYSWNRYTEKGSTYLSAVSWFYFDFVAIIHPSRSTKTKIEDLKELKSKLLKLEFIYEKFEGRAFFSIVFDANVSSATREEKLRQEDAAKFYEQLNNLKKMITTHLVVYSSMGGGGAY